MTEPIWDPTLNILTLHSREELEEGERMLAELDALSAFDSAKEEDTTRSDDEH